MNVGEKINNLRKKNHMSQDSFAEMFHVTRQTVSNWENGKSCPDLEMLCKISDRFEITTDELLKDDVAAVEDIYLEKKKRNILFFVVGVLFFVVMVVVIGIGIYKNYEQNAVSLDMNKNKTYHTQNTASSQTELDVATGHFQLQKSGKLNVNIEADTDDGELHIKITDDKNKRVYYQIDDQRIDDSQTLYFDKGSYLVQITADDYTEDIVSLSYHVKVNNRKLIYH